MNTLYRIYTEHRDNLRTIVGGYFKGFTLIEADGYWMGLGEASTIVEIITDDSVAQRATIYDLAEAIREQNGQQSVIVTEQKVAVVNILRSPVQPEIVV